MALFSTTKRPTGSDLRSLAMIAAVTTAVTFAFMQIEGPASLADANYHTPPWAIALHVGTVLPAVVLGLYVLARRKGGGTHRRLGMVWMGMMITTAVASFWIRGGSGAFSGIHLFSVGTLIAVPIAIWRARVRDIHAHRQIMVSLYIGLIVAGVFAIDPDRVAGKAVWHFLSVAEQQGPAGGGVAPSTFYQSHMFSRMHQPMADIQSLLVSSSCA